MSRRDTKWIAPAKRGDPPKNPSSTSAGRTKPPVQKIVLVCGRGWGKQMALEQWEALYREFMDEKDEA